MIRYSYDTSDNIICAVRVGNIQLSDLLESVYGIHREFNGLKNLSILDDSRGTTSDFTTNDFPVLLDAIRKLVSNYNEVRHAIIVDTPSNTVLSFLFEELSHVVQNYNFKTFSTTHAAKLWLIQSVN